MEENKTKSSTNRSTFDDIAIFITVVGGAVVAVAASAYYEKSKTDLVFYSAKKVSDSVTDTAQRFADNLGVVVYNTAVEFATSRPLATIYANTITVGFAFSAARRLVRAKESNDVIGFAFWRFITVGLMSISFVVNVAYIQYYYMNQNWGFPKPPTLSTALQIAKDAATNTKRSVLSDDFKINFLTDEQVSYVSSISENSYQFLGLLMLLVFGYGDKSVVSDSSRDSHILIVYPEATLRIEADLRIYVYDISIGTWFLLFDIYNMESSISFLELMVKSLETVLPLPPPDPTPPSGDSNAESNAQPEIKKMDNIRLN